MGYVSFDFSSMLPEHGGDLMALTGCAGLLEEEVASTCSREFLERQQTTFATTGGPPKGFLKWLVEFHRKSSPVLLHHWWEVSTRNCGITTYAPDVFYEKDTAYLDREGRSRKYAGDYAMETIREAFFGTELRGPKRTASEINSMRLQAFKDFEALGFDKKDRDFTCDGCNANDYCPWAYDLYNTGGACLAEK